MYRRHERAVPRYMASRTRDAETAADLTAEAFAAALLAAHRFRRRREPATAWLFLETMRGAMSIEGADRPPATVVSAVPILPARDTAAAAAWYRDRLGFGIRHVEDEYAIVRRDGVEIHFWGPSRIEPAESSAMLRLEVRGIAALHAACEEAGIVHPGAPLERKPWGTDEFAVTDDDGNLVTFFERAAAPTR